MDPDLLGQIQIPERAMPVSEMIYQTRSQIGIRVIANLLYLRTLILQLQMRYSSDRCLETADFKRKKGLHKNIKIVLLELGVGQGNNDFFSLKSI
jgi:hypothetical protein